MNQIGGEAGLKKSALRKMLRRRRNALDRAQQAQAADDLAAQLQSLPAFRRSESIALYLASDGEIDPGRALDWSLAHGKRCYAPVIIAAKKNALRFAEITAHTQFHDNRFGIAEPLVDTEQLIDAPELDLALLPLVGFDRHGNRIGMGGGFYDTTFAYKKTNPNKSPRLVGLAHEMQRVEKIDAENWDIPITAVVTDRGVYECA